jgi:hypothetical protein
VLLEKITLSAQRRTALRIDGDFPSKMALSSVGMTILAAGTELTGISMDIKFYSWVVSVPIRGLVSTGMGITFRPQVTCGYLK